MILGDATVSEISTRGEKAHQGVHLFRQAKNFAEICDFRIRTEIHNFKESFTVSGFLKWEGSPFTVSGTISGNLLKL